MTRGKSERETIVRWSDDPDEPMTVYTFRETQAKKLLRAGATLKREGKVAGKVVSWTLETPREWFRWPLKPRKASPARAEASRRALEGARTPSSQSPNEGNSSGTAR